MTSSRFFFLPFFFPMNFELTLRVHIFFSFSISHLRYIVAIDWRVGGVDEMSSVDGESSTRRDAARVCRKCDKGRYVIFVLFVPVPVPVPSLMATKSNPYIISYIDKCILYRWLIALVRSRNPFFPGLK